ncbi:MAG: hypothetical protein NT003_00500, partial [Candidatus Magasanikbacteria bacterium]|nr:hypothetical protein [Candidatus Magasanikbacteria bacterium]
MPDNPFLQKITRPGEENVDETAAIVEEILDPEAAVRYRELVVGSSKTPRQPRPNLKSFAQAALASQEGLLAASAEKQAENFLTIELKLKFNQQVESLLATGLLETKQGKIGVAGIPEGKL